MVRVARRAAPTSAAVLAVAGVAAGLGLAALCLRAARHEWGGPTVALEAGRPREAVLADHGTWAVYVRGGERSSDAGISCRVVGAGGGEIHPAAADETWWSTLGGVDLPHRGLGRTWRRLELFAVPDVRTGAETVTVTCPAPRGTPGPPHPPAAYALGPAPDGPSALVHTVLGAVLFVVCTVTGAVAAGMRGRRRPRQAEGDRHGGWR